MSPVKKLYKDCLTLAKCFGRRQGNEAALMGQVREQFKANKHERDSAKIKEHTEAAMAALRSAAWSFGKQGSSLPIFPVPHRRGATRDAATSSSSS
ncbi:hypothetical protein HYH02_015294 [Chlamydomonas schloesseri]|uniref:Complex 1 LYR protein domain-containing protein n=1 Tax=Chlamydomonas schloesseri TaxID=2026947 RepID=A0A835SJU0_9CHLO|nr:hypothetical protein HYH02_015294 [Chlamydomonas schloesseri]|eukprot:KAG2423679.1 hypothetical protein HYH02_015294 [Chlamydomonas schloesseri]